MEYFKSSIIRSYSSFCFVFFLIKGECEQNLTNSWRRETIMHKLNLTERNYRDQTSLDITAKMITNFDKASFRELTRLKKLDLSNNHLECLDQTLFTDLRSLEYLNLSKNKMK